MSEEVYQCTSATRDYPVESHASLGSCWFYLLTLRCRPESFPHQVQKPVSTPNKCIYFKLPLKNLCSVLPTLPSQDPQGGITALWCCARRTLRVHLDCPPPDYAWLWAVDSGETREVWGQEEGNTSITWANTSPSPINLTILPNKEEMGLKTLLSPLKDYSG